VKIRSWPVTGLQSWTVVFIFSRARYDGRDQVKVPLNKNTRSKHISKSLSLRFLIRKLKSNT
jgi:hypothetical protein